MINIITIPTKTRIMGKINRDSKYRVHLHPTTRSQLCTEDKIRIQIWNSINNNIMNWIKIKQEWVMSLYMCKCHIIKVTNSNKITITILRINTSNSTAHSMVTMTNLDTINQLNSSGIRNFGNTLHAKLAQQRRTNRSFVTMIIILNTLWCMKLGNHSIGSSSLSTRFVLLKTECRNNKCRRIISNSYVLNIMMSIWQNIREKHPKLLLKQIKRSLIWKRWTLIIKLIEKFQTIKCLLVNLITEHQW